MNTSIALAPEMQSNGVGVERVLARLVVGSRALSLVQLSVTVGYWVPRSREPLVDTSLLAMVLLSAGVSCVRMLSVGTPRLPVAVGRDVALGILALACMPWLIGSAEVTTWANWAYPFTLFTACSAGVCFSVRAAGLMSGGLAAAYLLEARHLGPQLDVSTLAANACSYLLFGAAAAFLGRLLRRLGRLADDGAEAQADLAALLAGEQVREQVRPLVHAYDNVVTGVTDVRMPAEVRQAYVRDGARLKVRARAFLQSADVPSVCFLEELHSLSDPQDQPAILVDTTGWEGDVEDTTARSLLDAVEEAVRNARKHAQANGIAIRATSAAGGWTITVTDDGRGFDTTPQAAPDQDHQHGHGLLMLRGSHLSRLGIGCTITSTAGVGTVIALSGQR